MSNNKAGEAGAGAANGVAKQPKKGKGKGTTQDANQAPHNTEDLRESPMTQALSAKIEALKTIPALILEVDDLFQKCHSVLRFCESEADKIATKNNEIKELKSTIRQLYTVRDQDTEELRKKTAKLDEDFGILEAQKKKLVENEHLLDKARDSQERACKRKESDLQEQEKKLKSEHQKRVDETKVSLEQRYGSMILDLEEKDKRNKQEIADLKARLILVEEEAEHDRTDYRLCRAESEKKTQKHQHELEIMKKDFAIETQSDDHYKTAFLAIQSRIKKLCLKFFIRPLEANEASQLRRFMEGQGVHSEIAEYATATDLDSSASTLLRTCVFESLITQSICKTFWQPFLAGSYADKDGTISTLHQISKVLSGRGSHAETAWRAMTVCGLQGRVPQEKVATQAAHGIIKRLGPCIQESDLKECSTALQETIQTALEIWDTSQRDKCPLTIHTDVATAETLDAGSEEAWLAENQAVAIDVPDRSQGLSRDFFARPNGQKPVQPMWIFPNIVRKAESPSPSSTSSSRSIIPGRVLFEDSFILAVMRKESMELEEELRTAKARFASTRRNSRPAPT